VSDFALNTSRIESSEISEDDKKNICHRNISNLFNNIRI